MLRFRTVPVVKIVMDKKGNIKKFRRYFFLSHSAEEFRRGNPLVFQYLRI